MKKSLFFIFIFLSGGTISICSNNCINNPDMLFTISGATYGQSCVRLAKLSPDGVVERRSVLRCEARKSYFHKLWLVDGNDIYFGIQGKQGYAIESVSIKD